MEVTSLTLGNYALLRVMAFVELIIPRCLVKDVGPGKHKVRRPCLEMQDSQDHLRSLKKCSLNKR